MAKSDDPNQETPEKAASKAETPKKDASQKDSAKKDGGKKEPKGKKEKPEAEADSGPAVPAPPPRLKLRYDGEVRPRLKERFKIANDNAVPRLLKIVIDMGVKDAVENKARVEQAAKDLAIISGQRPIVRKARKAISGFKLREGMPIACKVTLRRQRMWEFADRLFSIVLPRIRDFRGVKDKLDGRGNFTLGLSEQSVFPEIEFDKIEFQQGMHITFVTNAGDDERGHALLKELGMPFQARETKSRGRPAGDAGGSGSGAGSAGEPAPAAGAKS